MILEVRTLVKKRSELLRIGNEKEKREASKPQIQQQPSPAPVKKEQENILKSVHPTTDELSSISTQSGLQESKKGSQQVLHSTVTTAKSVTRVGEAVSSQNGEISSKKGITSGENLDGFLS